MRNMILAVSAAALPAPILAEVKVTEIGVWTLAEDHESCNLSASYDGGTMLSVYAEKTENVMFMIQNPKWHSVKVGATYKLDVEFDDWGEWNQTVTGATDKDGNGFIFLRSTAENKDGDNFVAEFMGANSMRISRDNLQIAKLSLIGTSKAVAALLRCARRKDSDPFDTIAPDKEAPAITTPAP